ncbi:MAG: D-amino acid dehydrogenase [Burkholderiaceae bacterium]|jgi:D-amino-acid dehydrogenase|nr:D-amino acid dehydrogenase [Betaproteobacteria bacterium]
MSKHVIIVGGGITGITAAYQLIKQGFKVSVVERHRYPAMETSYANGGQLSASNAEVWTHPSTMLKALKWLFRADAPLLVSAKPSWHKLSWFFEFMSNIPKYETNTIATASLAIAAREHLFAWAREEGIEFDLKQQGILHIYRDKKSFDHAAAVNKLLAKGGLDRRAVSPSEMTAIEPNLSGSFYGGFYTESDSTGDIHRFTNGLAKAAEARGASVLTGAAVTDLGSDGQHAWVELNKSDRIEGDAMVICAGVESRRLASKLGDRINIYPVKGYSITVQLDDDKSKAAAPQVSLLDDETKLVSSRLGEGRFRVAGTAEFNGFDRNIRADRIEPLVSWVKSCFPGVSTRQVIPWAGLRPMMPDMMPRVCQGSKPNIFYNTGHGHLGWTLGAITAVKLSELVSLWQKQTATASSRRLLTKPAQIASARINS